MKVKCEGCRRRFEPEIHEVATPDGGVVGTFTCPHCGTAYESYTVDAQGVRMRARLHESKDPNELQRLQARIRDHVRRGRGRVPA